MKKRNRVLALTMAAAMSASLLAGCGSSTQQGGAAASSEASASTTAAADGEEDNIIRVGVVCSMTGGSAIYGEGAQNAIDMAVEEINGGDSGYKIEIVNGGKVVYLVNNPGPSYDLGKDKFLQIAQRAGQRSSQSK